MKIKYLLAASTVGIATAFAPNAAFAQSTGSVDFEENVIVVTGSVTTQSVEGVIVPDTSKAKQVLTQEQLERNNPGQTVLDSINMIPGVTFTNNDAYGSSGGQLSIRGFSADRISLTFDGVPLNDSGNYAIYSNQQLDPELIEQVNVNLGSTDVDSPTAAATGSTVNFRTRLPKDEFGVQASASIGEYNFYRIFGAVDSGDITGVGTRLFLAASHSEYDNPYNNYGKVNKEQYNGRIYQEIGASGDFVSISGHYNENRNNFFGSVPLRVDTTISATDSTPRIVGSGSSNRFPTNSDEREYDINYPCTIDTPQPGVADTTNSCGTEFDRRYNPSNTGNIRGSSRFTLTEGLTLTVDPSFQYVKANGGGTATAREYGYDVISSGGRADCRTTADSATVSCQIGYLGGSPYAGRDLNGDGDTLDSVTVLAPSQTRTRRYGLISNLIWELSDDHVVRVSYTHDYANHRQTGQVGLLQDDGEPYDVFPVNSPEVDSIGTVLQKRDRQSYATLDQVSGEYTGSFFADTLSVALGVRAPFFTRDLNNYCFTTSDSGFVDCFGQDETRDAAYAAVNPTVQGPQQRVLKYDKILPNLGLVYHVTDAVSAFSNYSKGLQVPGTDALYNAFYFDPDTPSAKPDPETSDNFDLGLRYRSGMVQGQLVGWYTKYKNRLASAYDPETERNVYRNLGDVNKYGVDASVAFQPIPELAIYLFGSLMESEIQDDVQSGSCSSAQVAVVAGCSAVGDPIYIATAGKSESGSPSYSYGIQGRTYLGPVEIGVTAKKTGGRYIYDTNLPIYGGTSAAPYEIYSAKTNAYWLVNLDARINLEFVGLNDGTYLQFNVYNLFDELYVGSYTSSLNQSNVIADGVVIGTPGSAPFAQIGAPRTISATIGLEF